MNSRRSLLAVIALVALIVAACGGTPGANTPSASAGASAALSGEIRISGWSSSPTEDALLTDSINAFMTANPNVKVKWEPIAKDYDTVLKTNIAAGTEAAFVGWRLPAEAARFIPFLWAAGGDLAANNNDKAQAAPDFYTGFEVKDKVSKLPSEIGMGGAGEAFEKGKPAMVFEGGWLPAD